MQVHLVDVFTTTPGLGNPGAVVLEAGGLSGAEMGGVAAKLGLETTFVDGTTLRYYTPSGTAMMLCGHGTLAALAAMGKPGRFSVSTPVGDLAVAAEGKLFGMAMPPVIFGELLEPGVAATGLSIAAEGIDGPVQVAGAGRPKLIVPLRSLEALDGLRPDDASVEEACAATGATGIYAFTCKERVFGTAADARHFPAGSGIKEDPVTGVGALALAWYLWRHGAAPGCGSLKIAQGHAMGRPGMVMVKQEPDGQTWVYGQAVIGGTRTV
jgi:trans-2,3-dihydro-3-hydroxyanthranilate isomerase